MIEEIIRYLRNTTSYKYYFNLTSQIQDCVVYSFSDSGNDKIKKNARLELRIICTGTDEKTILRLEDISNTINNNLLTKADNSFSKTILNIVQNGGGLLVENGTKTTHKILYYDILYKERGKKYGR